MTGLVLRPPGEQGDLLLGRITVNMNADFWGLSGYGLDLMLFSSLF